MTKKKKIIVAFLLLLIALLLVVGNSDWHLNRNQHNKLIQGKLRLLKNKIYEDEAGLIWELQPHHKNTFHQPKESTKPIRNPYPNVDENLILDPENPNLKFLSKITNGASYETIMQPNGTFLTEGKKQGTYNYSSPSGTMGNIKHVFLDVIPHLVNSNYKTNGI